VEQGGSLLATFETKHVLEPESSAGGFWAGGCAGDSCGGAGDWAAREFESVLTRGSSGSIRLCRDSRNTNWLPRRGVSAAGGGGRESGADGGAGIRGVSTGACLTRLSGRRRSRPWSCGSRAGAGRQYFPGNIEHSLWIGGNTDLSHLLQNTIRWVAGDGAPVRIEGDGLIEAFAWETEPGFAVHVLNYTNPNTHRGWLREFYPIGEQRVRLQLPAGKNGAAGCAAAGGEGDSVQGERRCCGVCDSVGGGLRGCGSDRELKQALKSGPDAWRQFCQSGAGVAFRFGFRDGTKEWKSGIQLYGLHAVDLKLLAVG